MTSLITPGSKWLLDGKTEVIIIKPSTRSNSSYTIEIPGQSIQMVATDRLTPLNQKEQGDELMLIDDESPSEIKVHHSPFAGESSQESMNATFDYDD